MSKRLHNKVIILIEDNLFLADVIIKKLEHEGATVKAYGNGLEGLAGIRNEHPDLVLLDIAMPVMNGYEVLQVMHAEALTESIPVIVISNSGQPVEIDRVKDLGVRDYLVKVDFEPDQVINKVCEALGDTPVPPILHVPTPPHTNEAASDTPHPSSPTPRSHDSVRVLVVEDDPLLRNMLSMKLSKVNCPYMFSSDGMQALELTERFEPDVVVLDLMLPGKDGFAVLEELKQHEKYRQLPVVIFSNKDTLADKDRATQLGADRYFIKATTDLNEFIAELKRLVKSRQN